MHVGRRRVAARVAAPTSKGTKVIRRDGARDVDQVAADLRQVKGVGDSLLAGGAVGAEDGHRGINVNVSRG